ncbi:MAG: Gmad2 immunoglobulin-like domain-containing protein [Methyloceanibacter sp.]
MSDKMHSGRGGIAAGLAALGFVALAAQALAMGSIPGGSTDNCDNADGALSDAAFVIATTPSAGDRVESGFEVKGCSRTFESNVNWRLVARNGTELARGNTQGGGVDGPGPFAFAVAYTADRPQIGHLEVFEEDASDGEGFPPGRIVLPLILKP